MTSVTHVYMIGMFDTKEMKIIVITMLGGSSYESTITAATLLRPIWEGCFRFVMLYRRCPSWMPSFGPRELAM